MKTLIFLHQKQDLTKLNKYFSNSQIILFSPSLESYLKELKLEYSTPNDYLKLKNDFVYAREAIQWIRSKLHLPYEGLSLTEIADFAMCWNSNYFNSIGQIFKTIDILTLIIKKEAPDQIIITNNNSLLSQATIQVTKQNNIPLKTNKVFIKKIKITPYILRRVINFQQLKRRFFSKKQITISQTTKILTLICSQNYIKPIKPVLQHLHKRNQLLILRAESMSSSTKDILEKENLPYNTFETYLTRDVIKKINRAFRNLIKKYKSLISSPDFINSLDYNSINIYQLLKPLFSYFFTTRKRFLEILTYIELMKKILAEEKPSMILSIEDANPLARAMIMLANLYKIPTLLVQHGTFEKPHIYKDIITTKFAVWGEETKKNLIIDGAEPKKIIITGQPNLDALQKREFDKEKVYSQLNIPKGKQIITFASQTIQDEENEILLSSIIKEFKNLQDIQLVIKLHPTESGELQKKLIAKYSSDAIAIKDIDLYELIKASKILMTYFSTVATEAMLLKIPVITVNLSGKPDLMPFAKIGAAYGVYSEKDIIPAVKKVLADKKIQEKLSKNAAKYTAYFFYKQDGKATQRLLDMIDEMLQTNNPLNL